MPAFHSAILSHSVTGRHWVFAPRGSNFGGGLAGFRGTAIGGGLGASAPESEEPLQIVHAFEKYFVSRVVSKRASDITEASI